MPPVSNKLTLFWPGSAMLTAAALDSGLRYILISILNFIQSFASESRHIRPVQLVSHMIVHSID
jgi:hypothetical protein